MSYWQVTENGYLCIYVWMNEWMDSLGTENLTDVLCIQLQGHSRWIS